MFPTIIARCPGPERAKPPHTRLYSRYDAIFCKIGTRCKRGTLSYKLSTKYSPKRFEGYLCVFWHNSDESSGFSIVAIFCWYLSDCGVMNSDQYGSISVVLGSCVTFWMSWRCALGGILEGQPLLGRFIYLYIYFF